MTATVTDQVSSPDGTSIVFDRQGDGPPLILVVGAFCDRHAPTSLAAALAPSFTVYAYDRRGRGSSTDTAPYTVQREIEDLAALIERVGGGVFVFGHSSGAALALEAAAAGVPMARLAVYEPPYVGDGGRRPAADLADQLTALIAAGLRSRAGERFLVEAVGMSIEDVAGMAAGPGWDFMTALAHTLPYDLRVCNHNVMPGQRMASIGVPTLVLAGGASADWARPGAAALAQSIPGSRSSILAGQHHGVADDVLVPVLVEFFRTEKE